MRVWGLGFEVWVENEPRARLGQRHVCKLRDPVDGYHLFWRFAVSSLWFRVLDFGFGDPVDFPSSVSDFGRKGYVVYSLGVGVWGYCGGPGERRRGGVSGAGCRV